MKTRYCTKYFAKYLVFLATFRVISRKNDYLWDSVRPPWYSLHFPFLLSPIFASIISIPLFFLIWELLWRPWKMGQTGPFYASFFIYPWTVNNSSSIPSSFNLLGFSLAFRTVYTLSQNVKFQYSWNLHIQRYVYNVNNFVFCPSYIRMHS